MSSKKHEHTKDSSAHKLDRRGFLKGAATGAAALAGFTC